jgi:hypothetical protein
MKSGLFNTIVAAIVGGVVGAVVVYACGAFSTSGLPEKIDKLKVGELNNTEKMMLWEDGKDNWNLLIQNGGLLASTRVIAQQVCGNAMLANCVLTTPDNPTNPLEQCEIFTEMGSSKTEGGLLTVRSPDGGNVLANQGVSTGSAYTVTYESSGAPVCLFRKNDDGKRLLGQFVPGKENGTIAIMFPQPPPQQDGQPAEMSQSAPAVPPMSPSPNPPLPGNPPQGAMLGVDQNAQYPPVNRQ